MVEEPQEVVDREVEDPCRRRRPDGRGDRDEEVVAEARPEPEVVEVVAERRPGRGSRVEPLPRVAVEAQHVREHAPVAGSKRRSRRGQPATATAGAELQVTPAARQAERHVAGLRLHAKLRHQFQEPRVRDVVVDDESHVDGKRTFGRVDRHGLDVAADRRLRVVQPDLVLSVQRPGGAQPADPAADHRDAHQRGAASGAAARASSVRAIPAAASRPIVRNVRPRNGCTSRSQPPRRMSAE